MPRKPEKREGRGTPAGVIRRPIAEPPMRNIKDERELDEIVDRMEEASTGETFDSDEDYGVDERLGDELAKVEEQIG